MKVYNKPLSLNLAAMNTDLTSVAMQLYNMVGFAIQLEITGTPTGSFKLQASCDSVVQADLMAQAPMNWTDIPSSSTAITASGSIMWNVIEPMYNFVRVLYTDASGGSSDAIIAVATFNGKGI